MYAWLAVSLCRGLTYGATGLCRHGNKAGKRLARAFHMINVVGVVVVVVVAVVALVAVGAGVVIVVVAFP